MAKLASAQILLEAASQAVVLVLVRARYLLETGEHQQKEEYVSHRAANRSEMHMSIQISSVDTNAPFALAFIHN